VTQRPSSPPRVSSRGAQTPRATQQPPRSTGAPVRRSTRQQPTSGWARTGAQPTTASSPAKGGGDGNGGNGDGGKKAGNPDTPRWKRILKITGITALISLFVTIAVGSIALMVIYSRLEVPEASDVALAQSSIVYWANDNEMGRVGEANREIISIDDLPDYVPHAFVAAEDRSFYTNPGIDFTATVRALYKTIILGDTQGGSTITQQYVERYYVGETTTDIPGKIKEALLALKVDSEQTKDEVLENYMNTIYLGRGAYGIQAAAEAYFDKDAAELTLSEAALIAGIIPAPSAWDPRFDEAQAEYRWNYVLDGMVEAEFITQEERDEQEFPETVEFEPSNTFGGTTGYILREALNEAMEVLELDQEEIELGGFRVKTTVRPAHQRAVEKAVRNMPDDHADNLKVAATTVNARTGAITSMYGGEDYLEVQRNAVTQDISQAGSTFKPFAMLAALSSGYSLDTQYLSNDDTVVEGFENPVNNFGGYNFGWIDMVEATKNSVNTYYVQLAQDVGPDKVMEAAIAAGIPEDTVGLDDNAANVLGTASPTALAMTQAYATMADGGLEKDTFMVSEIVGPDGEVVYKHEVDAERVFDADVMADTTYAMQQVVQGGSAYKAADLGRPLAGKTGTSNDNRSAWFVGFSPQIVGTVTLYQPGEDGSVEQITPFGGYSSITGGSVPTDIWVDMMGTILDRYDVEEFPERADVGTARNSSPEPEPSETAEPSPTPTPEPSETSEPIVTPSPEPSETTPPPVTTPTPEPSATPAPSVTAAPDDGTGDGGGAAP